MPKTWNLTYYRDSQPAAERTGLSTRDAAVEIDRLARGEAPTVPAAVELEFERIAASSETGELSLAA
jgi:hypothetical protein